MNDIINWIATNDTLLIRIGFTAILVLVIVYVYRFFFVPKINIVAEASTAVNTDKPSGTESGKPADEKTGAAPQSFDLSVVAKKTEEIENLKLELTKLKTQVGDSEKIIADLKEQAAAQPMPAQAENGGTSSGTNAAGASADPDLIATLNGQIEQLQNRLAEYEIIAEDISEISQLRQENSELKKKLGASSATVSEAPVEVEKKSEPVAEFNEPSQDPIVEEPPPEETPVEEVAVNEEVAEIAAAPETESEKAERVSAESIKLVSDKEVTSTEKELINQFEEILTKKGS